VDLGPLIIQPSLSSNVANRLQGATEAERSLVSRISQIEIIMRRNLNLGKEHAKVELRASVISTDVNLDLISPMQPQSKAPWKIELRVKIIPTANGFSFHAVKIRRYENVNKVELRREAYFLIFGDAFLCRETIVDQFLEFFFVVTSFLDSSSLVVLVGVWPQRRCYFAAAYLIFAKFPDH